MTTEKTNNNCLQGIACPKCGSEGPFDISVTCTMTVYDSGSCDNQNEEWTDESCCTCRDCGNAETVKEFKFKLGDY